MESKLLVCFLLFVVYGHLYGMPQPSDDAGGEGKRGADIWKKLMIFNPEFQVTNTPMPDPNVPKKRKSRGEQWMMKFLVEANLDLTTTTTTAPTTTTTKSPKQIAEEKRKTQERNDPKNFLKKLQQLNLLGDEDKTKTTDEEVQEMDKKLHSMLQGCNDNSDCDGNSTCCYKKDPSKRGECIMTPHRLDQACSNLCGCQGKHEGLELECKVMEVALTDGASKITDNRQCKQRELTEQQLGKLTEQEFMKQVLKRMRENKRGPRTQRTQKKQQRVMFN